jgi:hypothetical protein
MTKKSFKTSFNLLLDEDRSKIKKKSDSKEIRATFIVKEDNIEKLKAIAYWERDKIKNILNEALSKYIELYEKEKGIIKLPK